MIGFFVFLVVAMYILPLCEAMAKQQDSQMQQNQSVVEAAHRSRELKRHAANPARVITNDDLERGRLSPNHEDPKGGAPTQPPTDSTNFDPVTATKTTNQPATSANSGSGSENYESKEAAAEDAEIARLKAQLDSAENALNWQQRQLLLEQNTIYSNPAYTTTRVGKAELDLAKSQIEQKQQEIESLKGPLANLEWRKWRRMQAGLSGNDSGIENYKSVPPSALVLPKP